jgi:hypothetical protein
LFDPSDTTPEYELAWPRELFVAEATALLADPSNPSWLEDAELLLEEAFTSEAPKEYLRTAKSYELPPDLLRDTGSDSPKKVARAFLTHLAASVDKLPERAKRRPYWAARRAAPAASTQPAAPEQTEQLQQDWVRLVEDLQKRGYLDSFAPQGCVAEPTPSPAAEVLAAELTRSLQMDILWPLHYQDWDNDTFYGLVEVVHDLVARPRHRARHNLPDCAWHYSDFARTPGQVLYRWEVDQLLDRYGARLHLASGGEDKGRLVHPAGDDRDELVEQALRTPHPGDRDAVRHAVALFRHRGADREDKRSATLTLVALLEERRSLIKAELMSKDEGALFQIANQFAIRHRRADQHGDYPDAYLDWIFWCYLATVELTDRIVASQVDSP